MCSWNWGKFETAEKEVLNLLKKHGLFNIVFWGKWKCFSLFLFYGLFSLEYLLINISLEQLDTKWNFRQKISAGIHQKKIKISSKKYVMWKHWHLNHEKYFRKTISQEEFRCGLFTKLPRIIFVCNFSPSSFKLKRATLSPLTKKVF